MLLIYLFKTEANPIQLFIYLLKHNYLFFFYQAQQLLRRYNFVICYKLSRESKNEFKKGLIGLAPGGPNHFLNPKFQIPGSPLNIWKNHWRMADKKHSGEPLANQCDKSKIKRLSLATRTIRKFLHFSYG